MQTIVSVPGITIYQGDAEDWPGHESIDLVLTNPYGPMPRSLIRKPMVIHQWCHRKHEAELWSRNELRHEIGKWNDDRECFWGNAHVMPFILQLGEFRPEPGGWYPEDLVRILLATFTKPGQTIWDGFMGRGTIAKICREQGLNYVGVEQLPKHITLAREYLGV